MRTVFTHGFMYTVSCNPNALFYIAANKILSGKERKQHDTEAIGRKNVIVFYEAA